MSGHAMKIPLLIAWLLAFFCLAHPAVAAADEPDFGAPNTKQAWIVTENDFPKARVEKARGFDRYRRGDSREKTGGRKNDAVGFVFLIEDTSIYVMHQDKKSIARGKVKSWRQRLNDGGVELDIAWENGIFSKCVVSPRPSEAILLLGRSDFSFDKIQRPSPKYYNYKGTAEEFVLRPQSVTSARELLKVLSQ